MKKFYLMTIGRLDWRYLMTKFIYGLIFVYAISHLIGSINPNFIKYTYLCLFTYPFAAFAWDYLTEYMRSGLILFGIFYLIGLVIKFFVFYLIFCLSPVIAPIIIICLYLNSKHLIKQQDQI